MQHKKQSLLVTADYERASKSSTVSLQTYYRATERIKVCKYSVTAVTVSSVDYFHHLF